MVWREEVQALSGLPLGPTALPPDKEHIQEGPSPLLYITKGSQGDLCPCPGYCGAMSLWH